MSKIVVDYGNSASGGGIKEIVPFEVVIGASSPMEIPTTKKAAGFTSSYSGSSGITPVFGYDGMLDNYAQWLTNAAQGTVQSIGICTYSDNKISIAHSMGANRTFRGFILYE